MQKFKYKLGVGFVMAISAIGVLLWVLAPSTVFKFDNTLDVLRVLGQFFGILGFTLFGTSLILSAHFKFLENFFYGLNKIYERHSQIGQVAFMMLLFHPLLLLSNYNGYTFSGAINFFTPSNYWPINWGIFSLGLMILLIVLTLYLRPKYNIWKWTHKFMGLAFFFGAVHAFLIPSDIATYMPLRVYILAVFIFSIYSFIYHTILGKFLIKKYKYIVSGVQVLGGNVTEVMLNPTGEKLAFTSGQFVFVIFQDKNVSSESHPFSLSSATDTDTLSFTIKNLGDFTSSLPNLEIGSSALIEGPFGKFSYKEAGSKNQNKKQIWIAGGIGVTPFLSMIYDVVKYPEYSVEFYYCLKNEKEAVHLEELKKLESENNHIKIIPFYSDVSGFVNASVVEKMSGGLKDKDIFICAPPVMIRALRKQFLSLGVDSNLLHSEEFNLRD